MPEADAYTILASRHGQENSERYRRILQFAMTQRQADLAVLMPMTHAELAAESGLPLETIQQEVEELFKKGVVFPRDFHTREYPRFARNITQLHDASESLWGIEGIYTDEQKKEFWALWWDFWRNEWEPDMMPRIMSAPRAPSRVVPAYKSIKDIPGILPTEDMRVMVEEAGLISVVSCSCRKRKESLGDPCDRSHDQNCIQFNRAAEYTSERGHGEMLSKEEALKLIDQIEDDGLVHTWPNVAITSSNTLCSCCTDCCMFLLPMGEYDVPWTKYYEKSRFEAQNNMETCDGCQDCIERCQFDALELEKVPGQKKMKVAVDAEKCMGCGVCVLVCKPESLKMAIVRPPEHIPALRSREPAH